MCSMGLGAGLEAPKGTAVADGHRSSQQSTVYMFRLLRRRPRRFWLRVSVGQALVGPCFPNVAELLNGPAAPFAFRSSLRRAAETHPLTNWPAPSPYPAPHSSSPTSARPVTRPAADLLKQCARRLRSLFQRQPAQISYAVADVASYLSEAQEVVAWGRNAPYFSLEGYARAVYGSFEGFLLEISRLHFHDSWCFAGGHRPGEPRVMLRTKRITAAGGFLPWS
jgi:hypothetical protein